MYRKDTVPVTFNSELVGRAAVFARGAVDIVIHDENLIALLNHNSTVALSITPEKVKPKLMFKAGDIIRSKTTGTLWRVVKVEGDDPYVSYISVRFDSMLDKNSYVLMDPLNFELVE